MTGVDLAALRALAEKATQGERQALGGEGVCLAYGGDWIATTEDGASPVANAAFIAACDPQTVLALVEAVEAARRFYQEAPPPDDPPSVRSWGGPTYRILHRALGAALAPFRQERP